MNKNIVSRYKFNYDYSRTMWMKMFLASPDFTHGKSDVKINFEQALEIIKAVDNLTCGIKKIIYLVGWQGLGHDDCYPEMHHVNNYLKRDCDKTGQESLIWLCNEAKKYNTVVSFHGNIADEYSSNESHKAIVDANAVVKNKKGEPAVIEVFNGRDAYKISYKQFYESGLFKELWTKFMDTVPVKEAGTVHLDNFCIAESLNPETFVEEQDEARNKIIDYITGECGIDITTEYTYREAHFRAEDKRHPIRRKLYTQAKRRLDKCDWRDVKIRTLGVLPAAWWMSNITPEECIEIPVNVYSGHLTGELFSVFYGSMHGEDIWAKYGTDSKKWAPAFLKEFCTVQLPYLYLNRYERQSIENIGKSRKPIYRAFWSDGVVSDARSMSVSKNGIVLKTGDDVILPLDEENKIFIAYSKMGKNGTMNMPDAEFKKARVYEITDKGCIYLYDKIVNDKKIELNIKAGTALKIEGVSDSE